MHCTVLNRIALLLCCIVFYCDLCGQIKGTTHTLTSCIVRSVWYAQYRTFNNMNDYIILAYAHPIMEH